MNKGTNLGKSENWNYYGDFSNYDAFEEIIKNEYNLISEIIIKEIKTQFGKEELTLIDVGCGKGTLVNKIIERLENKIVIDFIDRYSEAVNQYENNVPFSNLGNGSKTSWEQFKINLPYDIFLANNSLGSMDFNNKNLVEKFKLAIKKNGIGFITLPSENGEYVSIAKDLWVSTYGREFEKTTAEEAFIAVKNYGIKTNIEYLTNEVPVPIKFRDEFLTTIFSIMMRMGKENIPKFKKPYSEFYKLCNNMEKMNFTYGVIKFEKA